MLAEPYLSPWIPATAAHRGGRVFVRRSVAPLGRTLPYRRASGEGPSGHGIADEARRFGWTVNLGDRALGDMLLGLGLVQALVDAAPGELTYQGPRPDLMRRCRLPVAAYYADGDHLIRCGSGQGRTFVSVPERPPVWLDLIDDGRVEVHAALPMRYYLEAEQALGVRLPASHAPLPRFTCGTDAEPYHVVFVAATSWPGRKDYGAAGFGLVARHLAHKFPANWRFTMVAGHGSTPVNSPDFSVLTGLDAVDCLELFGSAEVVVGNDTGLTHLAAMTERPDGTVPHVIGIYGRHAYNKWTTGNDHHHAVATTFSHMLAVADRCPVRDHLDDALWAASSSLTEVTPELITDLMIQVAGWR